MKVISFVEQLGVVKNPRDLSQHYDKENWFNQQLPL